jgi:hypothetical protein
MTEGVGENKIKYYGKAVLAVRGCKVMLFDLYIGSYVQGHGCG